MQRACQGWCAQAVPRQSLQPLTAPSFLPFRIPSGASGSGSHIGESHTNVLRRALGISMRFFRFFFFPSEVNSGVGASPWLTLHRICGAHRSLTYSSTPQVVSSDVQAKRYLHRVEEGSEFETMKSSKPARWSLCEPSPLLPMAIYPIIIFPSRAYGIRPWFTLDIMSVEPESCLPTETSDMRSQPSLVV